jgi:hypothetical protein
VVMFFSSLAEHQHYLSRDPGHPFSLHRTSSKRMPWPNPGSHWSVGPSRSPTVPRSFSLTWLLIRRPDIT